MEITKLRPNLIQIKAKGRHSSDETVTPTLFRHKFGDILILTLFLSINPLSTSSKMASFLKELQTKKESLGMTDVVREGKGFQTKYYGTNCRAGELKSAPRQPFCPAKGATHPLQWSGTQVLCGRGQTAWFGGWAPWQVASKGGRTERTKGRGFTRAPPPEKCKRAKRRGQLWGSKFVLWCFASKIEQNPPLGTHSSWTHPSGFVLKPPGGGTHPARCGIPPRGQESPKNRVV